MSARPSSNAFEDLVREHHAAVYRAAQRIVLNADDAQDVTQQVFLQVLEQGARFDDAENPRAVLCWMASRKALTHRRGNRRRQEREAERAAMNRENEMREMHEGALEQDERTMFGGLFRRLPEELRLALSLRFQDGMTYDQIGDVMTISGASAHDRVRRGLDRLRDSLRRGGLAAFAVDIEDRLAESPAEPVPTGLVERLLELKQATLASGVSLTLGAVLIGVTIVAGAFGVLLWTPAGAGVVTEPAALSADLEGEDVPLPVVEPTTPGRVALGRSGTEALGTLRASGGATATADDRTGTISGRITTPDGGPAEGVTVVASSYVLAGKVSAWGGRSSTDVQGRYALEVPVRHDDGEDYRVYVKYDEATITRARDARVLPGRSVEGFDIELERALDEQDGEFELRLEVRDEAGALLPADSIVVLERHLRTIGDGTWPRWEASGRLDGAGAVVLRGAKLGPKKVTARTRRDERWHSYTATFELTQAGLSSRVVTVAVEQNQWAEFARAATRPEGERLEGYSLRGHQSELVGGVPVKRSYPDVWVYPVPELSASDYLHDFLPNKLFRNSFQTAVFGEDPDPECAFVKAGLKPGRWVAVGYEYPYAPAVSELVQLTEEAPMAEGLQLRYEQPGGLTGVVLDVDGQPLEGAIVRITGTGPISTASTAELDGKIRKNAGEGVFIEPIRRTDAGGRFRFDGLPSNVPVCIMAFHPERAPTASATVYAASGATIDGLDIRFTTVRAR